MVAAASGIVERWAHLYADSKALSAGIMFLHLAGVLGAGGIAIAADRAALLLPAEAGERLAHEIERLKAVHNWVIAGLSCLKRVAGSTVVIWKTGSGRNPSCCVQFLLQCQNPKIV